ncbi:hypothetical protein IIW29_00570 [Candidatus Saccharibacteria bacterium]|nr:hypothetical protein [Candidatus Saccharibacteria bacterium]
MITAIEIKLKSFTEEDGEALSGHPLIATVSAAFFKTTLLTDVGKSLKTVLNPKRSNVVNLIVTLKETQLSFEDVARFTEALQKALDETSLF